MPWTDMAQAMAHTARRWPAARSSLQAGNWGWLARGAAAAHLGGLGLIMTMAWHDPGVVGGGTAVDGLPALHLAFLMATGATAALFTLLAREDAAPARAAQPGPGTGVDALLAQMSHELRTPLNAVIGFSDVMLRELYGPLGHTRYQEYAAHISESGGRLLKSSEDALAVTETMSAMMADRVAGRRERLLAGPLVREAWTAATAGAGSGSLRLSVRTCNTCEIACERRATEQALEHLLREAIAGASPGSVVEVTGRRRGGARSIEIRVGREAAPLPRADAEVPGSLRVILARLLLEMQGATLTCETNAAAWSALIAFPPRG